MVKSVLGVNHSGLRDWLVQRISAVYMAVYVIALVIFMMLHPDMGYMNWHAIFTLVWVKVATLIFFLSLLLHAWVGMWTIFTDYVTCPVGRLVLHTLVFFASLSFFFATLWILWSV